MPAGDLFSADTRAVLAASAVGLCCWAAFGAISGGTLEGLSCAVALCCFPLYPSDPSLVPVLRNCHYVVHIATAVLCFILQILSEQIS